MSKCLGGALLALAVIVLLSGCAQQDAANAAANASASVTKDAKTSTSTTYPRDPRARETTLEAAGYGYAIGDVVLVTNSSKIKVGDVVYYDTKKNKADCFGFSAAHGLARVAGQSGDLVLFLMSSYRVNGKVYSFRPAEQETHLIWGSLKLDRVPVDRELPVAEGEYVADKWVGLECPPGQGKNVTAYDRFTLKADSILGVVGEKIRHDAEAEKEIKSRVR